MDQISTSGGWRLKIICTRKIFMNPVGGETEYHNHGAVEAQGSIDPRVDSVDAVQKCGVQYHQGDNVRFVEGAVEHVQKPISYEQDVFDA